MTISFTLARRQFALSADDVRASLVQHQPHAIDQYWVEIDEVRWPVKQVVALATGLGKADFQSQSSRRLLSKLGFAIGKGNATLCQPVGTLSTARTTTHPASRSASSVDALLDGPGSSTSGWALTKHVGDRSRALRLGDFMSSNGDGLRSPGIYSWWVDETGAAALSQGLGHPVEPGLIYAGLAGATRSGGSTSSNTLWDRISRMHLGKRHTFSTLRLSVGSILAAAYAQPAIDEVQLTQWMHVHLRVAAIPVGDVETLDALETQLLAQLDPPLNLAKVGRTPLRRRLSELRKQYGGRGLVPSNGEVGPGGL